MLSVYQSGTGALRGDVTSTGSLGWPQQSRLDADACFLPTKPAASPGHVHLLGLRFLCWSQELIWLDEPITKHMLCESLAGVTKGKLGEAGSWHNIVGSADLEFKISCFLQQALSEPQRGSIEHCGYMQHCLTSWPLGPFRAEHCPGLIWWTSHSKMPKMTLKVSYL